MKINDRTLGAQGRTTYMIENGFPPLVDVYVSTSTTIIIKYASEINLDFHKDHNPIFTKKKPLQNITVHAFST